MHKLKRDFYSKFRNKINIKASWTRKSLRETGNQNFNGAFLKIFLLSNSRRRFSMNYSVSDCKDNFK